VYGKDAKKDLEILQSLTKSILGSSNKEELEALVAETKKISTAWGYKYGYGSSFHTWLTNKATT